MVPVQCGTRWFPVLVLMGSDIEQLCCSRPTCDHATTKPDHHLLGIVAYSILFYNDVLNIYFCLFVEIKRFYKNVSIAKANGNLNYSELALCVSYFLH